jgi:hypothetical protein
VSPQDQYTAHASAIFRPNASIIATCYEISDVDFKKYQKYEFRYDFAKANISTLKGESQGTAVICAENVDHRIDTTLVDKANVTDLMSEFSLDGIWQVARLPAWEYLEHCIAGARELGPDVLNDTLDGSFLYDRRESLRQYLNRPDLRERSLAQTATLSERF